MRGEAMGEERGGELGYPRHIVKNPLNLMIEKKEQRRNGHK
jgi:hypothetical protein